MSKEQMVLEGIKSYLRAAGTPVFGDEFESEPTMQGYMKACHNALEYIQTLETIFGGKNATVASRD